MYLVVKSVSAVVEVLVDDWPITSPLALVFGPVVSPSPSLPSLSLFFSLSLSLPLPLAPNFAPQVRLIPLAHLIVPLFGLPVSPSVGCQVVADQPLSSLNSSILSILDCRGI